MYMLSAQPGPGHKTPGTNPGLCAARPQSSCPLRAGPLENLGSEYPRPWPKAPQLPVDALRWSAPTGRGSRRRSRGGAPGSRRTAPGGPVSHTPLPLDVLSMSTCSAFAQCIYPRMRKVLGVPANRQWVRVPLMLLPTQRVYSPIRATPAPLSSQVAYFVSTTAGCVRAPGRRPPGG